MEAGGILSAIVRTSLRHRGVIIALAALFAGYGIYNLSQARYDVFPEFAPPEVVIRAEAPGFSPEQVEVLVTGPIEAATGGVSGVESLRSSSIQGLSAVTVRFQAGSDIYRARQEVAQRLASLSGLPRGVTPVMTPLTSSTGTVLALGLTSKKRSLMQLRTLADWTLKRRFLAVPGVAKVAVFGRDVRELQVQVDPDRLVKYRLSVSDVMAAAERATGVRGAGFVEGDNQRIVIRTEGQSLVPQELAGTVLVHADGANATLGDVARVAVAPGPPIGAALVMGKPGVIVVVSAQYGANTIEVTKGLERAVSELRPTLAAEGIELYPRLFRPADFIETALHNVRTSLAIGALLVVAVLFLFLFNFRTAAVSCTAIPLSLLAAVIALRYMGFSLNAMTMGGLAIAIGEVTDDAVVDVENILRRLRENRQRGSPRPAPAVVLDASLEVRSAVVYATFAVALVFIPVLTISGVAGRIFSPLGIAYILAIMASLGVALTVTPALSLALLGGRDLPGKEPPVVRFLKGRYRAVLLSVERHPGLVMGGVVALMLAGVAALPFLRGQFLPELREGHYIVHMRSIPGTSLDESLRLGGRVSDGLLRLPYVRSVAQRAGRAEKGEETRGTNASEMDLDLKPSVEVASPESKIREVLSEFPGAAFSVNTFLSERIEETISGYLAPVVVNIFGDDLDALDRKAGEVARVLGEVPGAREVLVQSPPGAPQLVVKLRKWELARWGFDPVTALEAVSTAYDGKTVGQVYDAGRVFDVRVILDPLKRDNIASVGSLPLRGPGGAYVRLGQFADIYETSGRSAVLHDGGRRVQAVTCSVQGRSVGSFVADAKKRILGKVSFPQGTYVEFTGSAEAEARSRRDLLVHSLLAGVGIIMLLSIVLANYRNVLLVLLNLPFALVGSVLIVLATGGMLSIGSMVGFVTIFGITLRNSIMMLSHYEHLVSVEGMSWGPEAALRGASERLAPIVMTASVTALGLLPLALASGTAGREIEGPMAVAILGGLVTSTLLNLLVLPALALRFGRFGKRPGK